ncbi:MAG: methyl-accepting chemotaxis protein [Kineosporiaceae bacterium]
MSWSIRRLFVAVLVTLNVVSAVLVAAALNLARDVHSAQDALDDQVAVAAALARTEVAQQSAAGVTTMILFVNVDSMTSAQKASVAALRSAMNDLSKAPLDGQERQAAKTYLDALGVIAGMFEQTQPPTAAAGTDVAALMSGLGEYQKKVDAVSAAGKALREQVDRNLAMQRDRTSSSSSRLALLMIAVVLLLGTGSSLAFAVFGRNLIRRLDTVSGVLSKAQAGDLTARTGLTGGDEISKAGRAADAVLERLAQVFGRLQAMSTHLGTSADQLRDVAAVVDRTAGEASAQAEVVARSADEVSRSVDSVASGTESMSAAISEIAGNAQEAAQTAGGAVSAVETTTASMAQLSESSREIGDVVRLITSIAEQTNLLALNATIEAARAGEAGKGFAVVADEVKQLAQETARATEDISRRVEAIQADANEAGLSIAAVASVIERIAQYQTTIAGAVEEQTATTMEMNRGVGDAAEGTRAIADSVSGLAATAGHTRAAVGDTLDSASRMQDISSELAGLVGGFTY